MICLRIAWVQELSHGLMLTFMAVHLFKFRFAVADQYWRSTDFGHYWFHVARVHDHSPIPVPWLCLQRQMRRSSPRPVSRGLLPLCPLLIVAPSAPCRPEVYLLPKQRDEQVAKLHFRAFLGTGVHGPCQDAGSSFGFQEELWYCEEGPRFACRMMILEHCHYSVSLFCRGLEIRSCLLFCGSRSRLLTSSNSASQVLSHVG